MSRRSRTAWAVICLACVAVPGGHCQDDPAANLPPVQQITRGDVATASNSTGQVVIGSLAGGSHGHVVIAVPGTDRVWDGNTLGGFRDLMAGRGVPNDSVMNRMGMFLVEQNPKAIPDYWKLNSAERLQSTRDYFSSASDQDKQNLVTRYEDRGAPVSQSWGPNDRSRVEWFQVPSDQNAQNVIRNYQPPAATTAAMQNLRCNDLTRQVAPAVQSLVAAEVKPGKGQATADVTANNIDAALRSRASETPRPLPDNTGPYQKQAAKDRIGSDDNAPRSQRLDRIQQVSPISSGFGGVILGSEPTKSPPIESAQIVVDKNHVRIEVSAAGQKAVFSDLNMTELWSAYQFLRPDQKLRGLGAARGDLGLVGIAKNNMHVDGSWDFGVHPAIANTLFAQDVMRLDMVLALQDPRLPPIPRSWVTYRWYDEPAVIAMKDGAITLRAATAPENILMRLRLWGPEKEVGFDTKPMVADLFRRFESLRQVDHFARVVAVLSWLDVAGKLPPLPERVRPQRVNVRNRCYFTDIPIEGAEILRQELKGLEDVHIVPMERGKTYVIDLESFHFDTYLRIEDSAGRKLAEDDDSGGNLNARLVFRPTQTDAYRLVATSYAKTGKGPYFLEVWDGQPATRLPAYLGLELEPEAGVCRISGVTEGGPAANAGLATRDVVVSYNGRKVARDSDLINLVAGDLPGTAVTLQVRRAQETLTLRVLLGSRE